MKRFIIAAIILYIVLALAGCTVPVAGHPDELSLIPHTESPAYTDEPVAERFDPNAPLEEEATDDVVDNPLSDDDLELALQQRSADDPDMMTFDDGADAGSDFLGETEIPMPTATPLVKDPYYTKVDVTNQVVTVYGLDENNEYTKIVRQMICSTGKNATPTPLGVFNIPGPVVRWGYFPKYNVYAQYLVRIKGSILFHSVLYKTSDENTLTVSSWYNLGKKASHGCVRMLPEDCKWLYENIKSGYVVEVYEGAKNAALTKSLLPPPPPVTIPAPTPIPTLAPTETPAPEPTADLMVQEPDDAFIAEPNNDSISGPADDTYPDVTAPVETPAPTDTPTDVPTDAPIIEQPSDPTAEPPVQQSPENAETPDVVPIESPPPAPDKESQKSTPQPEVTEPSADVGQETAEIPLAPDPTPEIVPPDIQPPEPQAAQSPAEVPVQQSGDTMPQTLPEPVVIEP